MKITITIACNFHGRDVSTGATGATEVAPKFWDTLTLLEPGGGQILPTIAEVAPNFFPWLRPWIMFVKPFDINKFWFIDISSFSKKRIFESKH